MASAGEPSGINKSYNLCCPTVGVLCAVRCAGVFNWRAKTGRGHKGSCEHLEGHLVEKRCVGSSAQSGEGVPSEKVLCNHRSSGKE